MPKANKSTRSLTLSNRAHERLYRKNQCAVKHTDGLQQKLAVLKMNYHARAIHWQTKWNRMLTAKEKTDLFESLKLQI